MSCHVSLNHVMEYGFTIGAIHYINNNTRNLVRNI